MTYRVAVLAAAAALAGCTTFDLNTAYTRPDLTVGQAAAAEWQCRRQVADAPRTPPSVVGGAADAARIVLEAEQRERLLHACMRAAGFEPSEPAGWTKSLHRDALRALFQP